MTTVPVGDSTRHLIAAVKKLEHSLHTSGLPRWMSRLPVWWLSWHYCRMLDHKIARMRRIARKFESWLPAIRAADQDSRTRLEFIDLDHAMHDDIDATRQTMWELRAYCIDIATMFGQLGYQSAQLNRRQRLFLSVIEQTCVQAATMQETLVAHDTRVLALLQQSQQSRPEQSPHSQPGSDPAGVRPQEARAA
ncbi:hypothetical protein J2X54_003327 [Duganella sp. 3397]|uniref:hypothetical protein n=1 Tax=Duganella sp. 3397 TaxID=2817732 RepID=UPI00285E32B5|nr:hypothetical protein [Duganella sp. 3397]MDR7050840.1 hypothetical protein [Duganella sp. 3397]